ncbi:LRR receptor-like serine/threonine-protein kinase EFR [Elaeis guineensis]|uniref:LRR receptor-like serine/threonine-protein kinase EFR n=1 Tax=Elaeis guineensis var. tenera TaxID=51953 RepID=UPI003C6D3952
MEVMMLLLFFLLLLNSFNYCRFAATARTSYSNETDLLALLAFKDQITSDPSGVLRTWNATTHFCGWEGVTCGRKHQQRVMALDLSSRGLVGSVTPSIGNLTFLRKINLQSNSFFDTIPSEIGHLHRLQQLNLSFNSFVGEIPVGLSNCSNLRRLDLSDNPLAGRIPDELRSLTKLETLHLEANNITGAIPPWLGNLSSLYALTLYSNSLEGSIPEDLGNLANLRFFQVSANMLSGIIPLRLYNFSSLYFFNVAVNQLQGSLPPTLGNTLPTLNYLWLDNNQFDGPIPASLVNATGIVSIDFFNNSFSGQVPSNLGRLQGLYHLVLGVNQLEANDANGWAFIDSLTNCSFLQNLGLEFNLLGGRLPKSIANLSVELQFLAIGSNHISGNIPSGIENLFNLYALAFEKNLLTGNIPEDIGKLQMLQVLYLCDNKLTGILPSSLGNLTQLNKLYLYGNAFEGPMPSSLGNLQHLAELDLSINSLSGSIPKEIFNLTFLSNYVDFSDNNLIGELPLNVGSMINIRALIFSGNKLSGEIPGTLGNCEALEYLFIDNNFLHGSIPPSLSDIKALQILDLSRNNLSGPIPKLLANLHFLVNLNLSFNHLDGAVPTKGIFNNAAAISLLGNYGLCGGVPELHLPACPKNSSEKSGGRSHLVRVVIPIISAISCLTLIFLFVFLYWKQKPRKDTRSPASSLDDKYPKVSYRELAEATDGFSTTNLVGTGRYGSVYKGSLLRGNAAVAVKVFNLQQLGAIKSFAAECDALRVIRHRNLVKIITLCSGFDFRGYDFKALVFEFMPNGSLEEWLHPRIIEQGMANSLNLLQRLNIAVDVAEAMDYLHHNCQPPVVHCDLKPGNVLLDADRVAHVGDFGLAKILCEAMSMSLQNSANSTDVIRGTIGYVAPEYGAGGQVSTSGDVYSYGILLLEIFTGKRPVDDAFNNGLTLHSFVKMAFPEKIEEIIDPLLLIQDDDDPRGSTTRRLNQCLESVIRIGLMCSTLSPGERLNMRDVATEMHAIRNAYLGGRYS